MSEERAEENPPVEEGQGPPEGEQVQEEVGEGGGAAQSKADPEPEAATAAEPAPTCPQPPYSEDFNPFTDDDLKRILHEEECSDDKEGWRFVSRSEFVEVWRKADATKPVHLVKAFMHFPGIPPNIVADLIHDSDRRSEWDRFFSIINVIEEHKNFRVMYWLTKMPLTVSDRDLVQFIRRQYSEADNITYFLYRNATHPKAPPQRGVVRAETILSGVIVRPDAQDPNSTRMSLMLQTDVKGWIPHFVVNAFATRSPKQWHASLVSYYENVYSKELKSAAKEEGEEKTEPETDEAEANVQEEQSSGQ